MQVAAVDTGVDVSDSTLIAGVLEGLEAVPGSEDVISSADQSLFTAADFTGKSGQSITLPHDDARALLVIGLGDELSFDSLRDASGNAIRLVNTSRAVSLLAQVDIDGATRAVVEGSVLGAYTYAPTRATTTGTT